MANTATALTALAEKGLLRTLRTVVHETATRVTVDGKNALLLCSNDYLGLSKDKRVIEAAVLAMEKYGAGSGASRLISGTQGPHAELEEEIRKFKNTEAALLFNSGYAANTGAIPALIGRDGEIFSDKLNHASIIDGCILSRAKVTRYAHADVNALEDSLKRSTAKEKLIVTDSIFSMDGDVAPIKDINDLAKKYNALLYIDDAHATGTLGKSGIGSLEHFGTSGDGIVQMGTLGKALGTSGAFIAADKPTIELLINRARSFVYSTSLPPSVCASAKAAIEVLAKDTARVERLRVNADFMRNTLNESGLDTLKSTTQIIPVLTKDVRLTTESSAQLLEMGFFVQGIRPPTVPEGLSRLRIAVCSEHTTDELKKAAKAIKEVLNA